MKKNPSTKPLQLSIEKVRELTPELLKNVIGGALNAYRKQPTSNDCTDYC